MTQTPSVKSQVLQVSGMDCSSCAKTIEVGLQQLNGVTEVSVSFTTSKVKVSYNSDEAQQIIYERIRALGYKVEKSYELECDCGNNHHQHNHSHLSFDEHHHTHSDCSHHQSGFLSVKVTHTVKDTTVAKIIHLVEAAQESRAPSQQWVDRFATVYTPIVILLAIAIALIPPLAFAQPFNVWLYRALVMLVIACPCALVISTPVSIVSAIGAATRKGVLFKGGNALETAGHLNTLAFDKTGTITQGLPIIQKVYYLGKYSADTVLQIAAALEQQSEHPLAKAIVAKG